MQLMGRSILFLSSFKESWAEARTISHVKHTAPSNNGCGLVRMRGRYESLPGKMVTNNETGAAECALIISNNEVDQNVGYYTFPFRLCRCAYIRHARGPRKHQLFNCSTKPPDSP